MACKIRVSNGNADFASKAVAVMDIQKGEVVGSFAATATPAPRVAYTSVQLGRNRHIELNSDLVYLNHSCDPSAHVDPAAMAFIADRNIKAGEEVTFFYPSTEWQMAQPFQCWCGAKNCLGRIAGAKFLSLAQLTEHGFINDHVMELAAEQNIALPQSSVLPVLVAGEAAVPCVM